MCWIHTKQAFAENVYTLRGQAVTHEWKSPRLAACGDLQVAAQALCLEEMTSHVVSEGAVFYVGSKRRRVVRITEALRTEVVSAAAATHRLIED